MTNSSSSMTLYGDSTQISLEVSTLAPLNRWLLICTILYSSERLREEMEGLLEQKQVGDSLTPTQLRLLERLMRTNENSWHFTQTLNQLVRSFPSM